MEHLLIKKVSLANRCQLGIFWNVNARWKKGAGLPQVPARSAAYLYGRQNPVSPFSTSSLNCCTQSKNATMAWSNLLSQKKRSPPEQYRGNSCDRTARGQDETTRNASESPYDSALIYLGLVCKRLQVRMVSVRNESVSGGENTQVRGSRSLSY